MTEFPARMLCLQMTMRVRLCTSLAGFTLLQHIVNHALVQAPANGDEQAYAEPTQMDPRHFYVPLASANAPLLGRRHLERYGRFDAHNRLRA